MRLSWGNRVACGISFSQKKEEEKTAKTPFVFDHYISVCSVSFSAMASKTGLSEEANKGCRFSVYFVRCKRKALGTGEGLSCQDCSPVLIHTPPSLSLSLSFSLPPFLCLSPQGQRHLKGLYLGVRPTKALCWISSICVWITLEPQIKKCWTLRVRSCGIDHCGFCRSLLV